MGYHIFDFIYDANGQKLAKTAPDGTKTYYAGNLVYKGNELKYILHSESKTDKKILIR